MLTQRPCNLLVSDSTRPVCTANGSRFTSARLRDLYLPPYLASLVIVADPQSAGLTAIADFLKPIFESLRPYGGKAWLPMSESEQAAFLLEMPTDAKFPQATWKQAADAIVLERPGKLPGSSTWTHIYGNLANTIKSDDQLVKLPLGLLWFGGSSNMDVLPRHGHGPPNKSSADACSSKAWNRSPPAMSTLAA